MSLSARFAIIVDGVVDEHFDVIDKKDNSAILDTIEQQLAYQANVETRNRKPIRIPNTIGATWELRCEANNRYRIFYDIDMQENLVVILAIGRKEGNILWVGRERIEL